MDEISSNKKGIEIGIGSFVVIKGKKKAGNNV
jgi:hypothetical protein